MRTYIFPSIHQPLDFVFCEDLACVLSKYFLPGHGYRGLALPPQIHGHRKIRPTSAVSLHPHQGWSAGDAPSMHAQSTRMSGEDCLLETSHVPHAALSNLPTGSHSVLAKTCRGYTSIISPPNFKVQRTLNSKRYFVIQLATKSELNSHKTTDHLG